MTARALLRLVPRCLRRFSRSERGSFSVETVMIFPLLIFAYVGIFTFFDAFRALNLNIRSSYTIGDMLSRETNPVGPDYIEGLNKIQALLSGSEYETILRVTVIRYDGDDDEIELVWSAVDGGTGKHIKKLKKNTLDEIEAQVPKMSHGDVNIVVETWSGFTPAFGIESYYFEHLVVTRPRFAPQLVWSNSA
jgi:hypothetical protein